MEIFPAIDIRGGKVVRLTQGDAARETMYHDDPVAMAERFAWQGARWIHVVDLDRAFGDGDNIEVIERIGLRVGSYIQIQLGGGLRTIERVRRALDLDVARIVVGTAVVSTPDLLPKAIEVGGSPRVAVGIDVRDGFVALRGWQETSTLRATDLAATVAAAGVRTVVYTDISRDGMLGGVDIEGALAIQRQGVGVIVSGGIGSIEDIRAVASASLAGAVVGRAIYERRFTLPEALACTEVGTR